MTPTPQGTPAIDANPELAVSMRRILDAAPQRAVIPDAVVTEWIEAVIALEKDRGIWHAHRVFGIGGSEIGELINTAAGLPNEYNTLDEISASKLLLLPPSRPNIHMRRGTAMEALAQKVYHRLTGYKSILETDEIRDAFSKPHPEHAFIVGNPDDVVLTDRNLLLITDFKVRGNLDTEAPVKLVNAAQVHWYGKLLEGNTGKLPDGYQVAELDIPIPMIDRLMEESDPDLDALADQIAAVNRPGFGMQIRTFKHNADLSAQMVRLADKFWSAHVLSGTPYQTPKAELPSELTKADHQIIYTAQNDFLRFKLAETVAKSKADEAKSQAVDAASRYSLQDWPFETDGLSTGFTKRFNINKAAEKVILEGVEKASLQKPSEKLDPEAMMRTLEAHGLLSPAHFLKEYDPKLVKAALKKFDMSESEFVVHTVRMGITTKKTDAEVRMLLEAAMEDHIKQFAPGGEPHPDSEQALAEQHDIDRPSDNDADGRDDPAITLA